MTSRPNHDGEITLTTPSMQLVVNPELGGRITSLLDRRSNREWLWKNPWIDPKPAVGDESYTQHLDAGGWDEILPSVSPCNLANGQQIPDHGDVVRLPAIAHHIGTNHCRLTTDLTSLPLRFTREIRIEGARLTLRYSLMSSADHDISWLWAMHPLFQVEPGTSLIGINASDFPDTDAHHRFANCYTNLPDTRTETFEPFACKLFSHACQVERIALQHPDGSKLELSWNPREIPYLGIWLNLGAWSGCGSPPYFNLGIEPTTSPHDSLATAIQANQALILRAGETKNWSLQGVMHPPPPLHR